MLANFRSNNGPEFIATAVQEWLGRIGVKTLYIAAGSPWENGYNESFNGSPPRLAAQWRDLLQPYRSQSAISRIPKAASF
jgi:transposase InsO family protein